MQEDWVLVVDDEGSARLLLETGLRSAGYRVLSARNGAHALQVLGRADKVDVIVSDQVMPEMDGFALLAEAGSRYPEVPFIMVTGHGDVISAVRAMKHGACDYVQKPCKPDELALKIEKALERRRVFRENAKLRGKLQSLYGFDHFPTSSEAMNQALDLARRVVASPTTIVALYGESGTGKELMARAIHYQGTRMGDPFVSVNCAGVPTTLLESELFGFVKGAFTDAHRGREGKFALADGGTLLLDEIGDMPYEVQAKLLRVLNERAYEKLGSNKLEKVKCRIIVATNRDMRRQVAEGEFREDLYHRINVFPIVLPPLRDRPEDIPSLVEHFIGALNQELGKQYLGVSPAAMEILTGYHWPGNVRELKNCLERAAILCEGRRIGPEHLSVDEGAGQPSTRMPSAGRALSIQIDLDSPDLSLQSITNNVLNRVLKACGDNKSLAAQTLKVNRKIFYRRG